MEFENSKCAIAQILYENGSIAGTGFLVKDHYVLTCAHVVKDVTQGSLEPVGSRVKLKLPFLDTNNALYSSAVIFYVFDQESLSDDAAVLYLSESLLQSSQITPLVPLSRFYSSEEIRSFGFSGGESAGRNITAITEGQINGGWVQIKAPGETGVAVEEGSSGSPVWCQAAKAFVGMIVARDSTRETARLGFILPTEKLEAPLTEIKRHSLLEILRQEQDSLSQQIETAYKVCRPTYWHEPIQKKLSPILSDLAQMQSEGMADSKLVQFAACLLNQPQIDGIKTSLLAWTNSNTNNLGNLLKEMELRLANISPQLITPSQPHLLISIQADKATGTQPYRVTGWLISNFDKYNAQTGEGARNLEPQHFERYTQEKIDVNLDAVSEVHLPYLIAAYLDEVGAWGVDLKDLTIEFFLPLTLINNPLEQSWIPVEFGFPSPLGVGIDCPHVVIRLQDRLGYGRGLVQWQTKWQELEDKKTAQSNSVFIEGSSNLKQLQTELKSALGLKLRKLPQTTKQGEIGLLVATGTPAALWIRSLAEEIDWNHILDQQVLDCCIETLPQRIASIRRNTPVVEDEGERLSSPELGHHLSFLWENPHQIPPDIVFSNKAL